MDKYEFNIKVEQIKKLFNKSDYGTAMKIADTIDWRRVRNTNLLSMVATIYEKNEDYEEAKEILLLAYERAPIGKRLLYKLAELALKQGNVSEAEDYYKEFGELASDDPRQQLLRYMILKTKGAPAQQLIHSLESYLSVELDEKWLYELAELYSLAGMSDRCVETCDKIMLMFGLGKYVEKAMDLKTQYAPLTNYQLDLVENRDKYEEKLRQVEQQYSLGKKRMAEAEAYQENTQAYQTPAQAYQEDPKIPGYRLDTGYVPEQEYMAGNSYLQGQAYQAEQGYRPDGSYPANQNFDLYQGGVANPEYALGQGYGNKPGYMQNQEYSDNHEYESAELYGENMNYNPDQEYRNGQPVYGENFTVPQDYAAEPDIGGGQSLETRESYVGNQYYDAGRNYGASLNYGTRQNYGENQEFSPQQNYVENPDLEAAQGYPQGPGYEYGQNYSSDQGYEASEGYVPEPGSETKPGYDTAAQSYKVVEGYEGDRGYVAEPDYDTVQDYVAEPGYDTAHGYEAEAGYDAIRGYKPVPGYQSGGYEPVPDYDTAHGYEAEAGYNTAQDYKPVPGYQSGSGYEAKLVYEAVPGYEPGGGYEAEAGYDADQVYEAVPGYESSGGYEAEAVYDTLQGYETETGYELPRSYGLEGYKESGQSYENTQGYDPGEDYKSTAGHNQEKDYNPGQNDRSGREYMFGGNDSSDQEYYAGSNYGVTYEYGTDEGVKAEGDFQAAQGNFSELDYSSEQESGIDQEYVQKGSPASDPSAKVEKTAYPDYNSEDNKSEQDQDSYEQHDFQQNPYGAEHSLAEEKTATGAVYGSREAYEDGLNQSHMQDKDQEHLAAGSAYYDLDSPIEDDLKARLQEAEVQEKLAREMSRISHEGVSAQDESRMDHTRVLDDIRRVGRPITAIPRPRGVYIPEEDHFALNSEPLIEEEVLEGPGLVEDGDEYDHELGREHYDNSYATEAVRPGYAHRESAATAQSDDISPIQTERLPELTRERRINYPSTVNEEPELEFEDLDDEEEIAILNHLMVEAKTPEKGMQIAVEALKQIHKENGIKNPVAKISGEKLSKRGVLASAEKLAGKDLVVERAGDMTSEALNELAELINNDTSGIIVVLIDNPEQMEAIHREHPALAEKFECIGTGDMAPKAESAVVKESVREQLPPLKNESQIKPQPRKAGEHYKEEPIHYRNYPVEEPSYFQKAWDQGEYGEEDSYYENDSYEDDSTYVEDDFYEEDEVENRTSVRDEEGPGFHGEEMDIDEFAQYACRYANEIDCNITGKSMLALYERIEIMEEDGVSLTRDNAEDLIEEAADRAEKPSLGKRLKGLFSSKYDKDGLLILKEEHFIY